MRESVRFKQLRWFTHKMQVSVIAIHMHPKSQEIFFSLLQLYLLLNLIAREFKQAQFLFYPLWKIFHE